MEDLSALLSVNGRVPRRAVLLADGSLGERVDHRDAPEVDRLSRLCEVYRVAAGLSCHSRHTSELIREALTSNSPATWDAVRDDVLTGDFDDEAAVATTQQEQGATMLVMCMVHAKDAHHLMGIACAMSRIVPRLSHEAKREVGTCLSFNLKAALDALALHGATLSRDVLNGLLDAFGKILGETEPSDSRVAEMVVHALQTKRTDFLRMFSRVGTGYLHHRPQILAMLIDHARAAVDYPSLALLARIAVEHPDLMNGHEQLLADIANACLSVAEMDVRTCTAAATLVRACAGCGTPLALSLAMALEACGCALVEASEHASEHAR